MRSQKLSLDKYETDKITNRYLERYDLVFEPYIDREVVLLELGVQKGSSLLLWHDYFPQSTVVGIDLAPPADFPKTERIHIFSGNQADTRFLSEVSQKTAPQGFDIIIDDASHLGELTRISFWHLFENHLKPGGIYVIEDWGTGYFDDWPDGQSLDLEIYAKPRSNLKRRLQKIAGKVHRKIPGPCHSYGMVGFIKELVDEQAAHDVTRQRLSDQPKRKSKFDSLLVTPSIVFIRKVGVSGPFSF
jgi:hypothetical protein